MNVADNIDLIDGTMCNVYVLRINGKIVQVDSGMKGSAKKIVDYYTKNNIKPDIVLITHYHLDHIGGLKIIYDKYKPEIYANKVEIPVIQGKTAQLRPKSIGARILFSFMKIEPVSDVKPLEELKMDGIKVIETPGHTPGSTSYYIENERVIFIGDAAGNVNGNLQINEKYTLDMDRARASLERIKSLSPVLVLPGHGGPIKI